MLRIFENLNSSKDFIVISFFIVETHRFGNRTKTPRGVSHSCGKIPEIRSETDT